MANFQLVFKKSGKGNPLTNFATEHNQTTYTLAAVK